MSDYRALIKVTQKIIWPMPRVEDSFSKLDIAEKFSTLDCHARYHHIPLEEDSIPKTFFTSPFEKYEYLKYHFWINTSTGIFPRTDE